MDLSLVADQEEFGNPRIRLESFLGAFDDDPAAVVATHDIHCYAHKDPAERQPARALSAGCDSKNLAALVEAAGRTNTVRDIGRRALRAGAELRQLQDTVISPAHALATL